MSYAFELESELLSKYNRKIRNLKIIDTNTFNSVLYLVSVKRKMTKIVTAYVHIRLQRELIELVKVSVQKAWKFAFVDILKKPRLKNMSTRRKYQYFNNSIQYKLYSWKNTLYN